MGFINLAEKTVHAKLVYHGIGAGGKTTSLQAVHEIMCPSNEVKLVSINTEEEATRLFDFLPINLGTVEGFQIIIQGFTVPGQPKYKRMRKYVLQGADAIVLVVDSQRSRLEENIEAMESLIENLRLNGLDPETIPIVVQYNKRDLDDIMSEEEMDPHFLFREDINAFPSVATEGQGVYETFVQAAGLLVENKIQQYDLGKGGITPDQVATGARDRLWEIFDHYRGQQEELRKQREVLEVTVGVDQDAKTEDDNENDRIDLGGEKLSLSPESLGLQDPEPGGGDLSDRLGLNLGPEEEEDPDFSFRRREKSTLELEDDEEPAEDGPDEPEFTSDEDELDFETDEDLEFDGFQVEFEQDPEELLEDTGADQVQDEDEFEGEEAGDSAPETEPVAKSAGETAQAQSPDPEVFTDTDLDIDFSEIEVDAESTAVDEGEEGLLDMALQSNLDLAQAIGELDTYKAALRRKNEELIKIAQNTIHDLNKPLSAIKLMLTSAVKGYLGDLTGNVGAGMENALAAVGMMERLIGDLMDSMVLDTSFKMNFEPVDLTIMVADVIRTLRYTIEDKNVKVRVEPLPTIRVDEWSLTKAFMNLVGNAIQYSSPDRDPRIVISYEDKDEFHCLRIADNGIGIPDGKREKLFLRFERGSNVAGVSGTGLGLHIIKEAVMGHGGHIRLESEEGDGTTFEMYLPKEPIAVPQSELSETVEV